MLFVVQLNMLFYSEIFSPTFYPHNLLFCIETIKDCRWYYFYVYFISKCLALITVGCGFRLHSMSQNNVNTSRDNVTPDVRDIIHTNRIQSNACWRLIVVICVKITHLYAGIANVSLGSTISASSLQSSPTQTLHWAPTVSGAEAVTSPVVLHPVPPCSRCSLQV